MDILPILVILVMVAATLWWVLRPLLVEETEQELETFDDEHLTLAELYYRREALYKSIRDLDEDFAADKIAEQDYNQIRNKLTIQVAHILRQIDSLVAEADQELDAEIDTLLASYQQKSTPPTAKPAAPQANGNGSPVAAPSEAPASASTLICANCHHQNPADHAFCSKCGQGLTVEALN